MELIYQCNAKHKEPWQCGRTGTLCPRWSSLNPQELLENDSTLINKKRYAVHNGIAFVAQMHYQNDTCEYWHGYPEGWEHVPPNLRRIWTQNNKVTKRQIKTLWNRQA